MADDEAHNRGAAHDGKNSEGDAEGYAPGKFLWRGALLELIDDGTNDPAVKAAIWVEGHGWSGDFRSQRPETRVWSFSS